MVDNKDKRSGGPKQVRAMAVSKTAAYVKARGGASPKGRLRRTIDAGKNAAGRTYSTAAKWGKALANAGRLTARQAQFQQGVFMAIALVMYWIWS